MGLTFKLVLALLIVGLTLLGIHSEHLGLGPGDRQVYATPVWAKLVVMVVFVTMFLALPRGRVRRVFLVGIGVVWLLQQQAISTSSTAVPPQVSVWLGGLVRIDTAYVCSAATGDDVFAQPGATINMALQNMAFADAACLPRGMPRYLEMPILGQFTPAHSDPARATISRAIDAILGVS
jgi:hypothetical protein